MKWFKKKPDKYDCIWNEPWENAPWEWQTCNCPEIRKQREGIIDISCSGENCGYFQIKGKDK